LIQKATEKFSANPVAGTAGTKVSVFTSPGRSGFGPELTLAYDSGTGNGPFCFGWTRSTPSIVRKTDKALQQYNDVDNSDTFILSGAEDLVPILVQGESDWRREVFASPAGEPGYVVHRYRQRIEGLFARIARWLDVASGISHWSPISKDNTTTLYGSREKAGITDPDDSTRVFKWLVCESFDDIGNAFLFHYKSENDSRIDRDSPFERNHLISGRLPQRNLTTTENGNRTERIAGEDLALRND